MIVCLLGLASPGCYEDIEVDRLCPPTDEGCEGFDYDLDGVQNSLDDFPEDGACAVRDEANCSACGVGCPMNATCQPEGVCACVNGWSGDACDVCPSNWMGDSCDTCANGWTGAACDACANAWTGDACDECPWNWTGENCDVCSGKWTGEACDT